MNRPSLFALVLLVVSTTVAEGQYNIKDIMDAHSRRAASGTTNSADLVDWNAYNRAGWRAINKGYFDTAEHEFLAAIKAAKRPGLSNPRLIARSYADYAWALQKQGRNAEAEPLARWALTAREASLESNSPAIAQSMNQLATLYQDVGRNLDAEMMLRRAIDSQANSTKANPTEHARSQTLMGLLMAAQRRYAEAEPFLLKSVKLTEKAQGASNSDSADAMSNLAWIYLEQGKENEARPYFEKALKVFERVRGESDPSVAHALNGLGRVLAKQGHPAEAEANYLRAIAIWEVRSGEEVSLLDVLRRYADLLDQEGRKDELEKLKARIAPLRSKVTTIEGKLGAWYRFPIPSIGSDAARVECRAKSRPVPPIRASPFRERGARHAAVVAHLPDPGIAGARRTGGSRPGRRPAPTDRGRFWCHPCGGKPQGEDGRDLWGSSL